MTVTVSVGLLLLRLGCGLTLAAHGAQKLFGWFGGSGFAKQREGMAKQGYKPAWLWASLVRCLRRCSLASWPQRQCWWMWWGC